MIVSINKLGRTIAVHTRWTEDRLNKFDPNKIDYDVFCDTLVGLDTVHDRINFGLFSFIRDCRKDDVLVVLNII